MVRHFTLILPKGSTSADLNVISVHRPPVKEGSERNNAASEEALREDGLSILSNNKYIHKHARAHQRQRQQNTRECSACALQYPAPHPLTHLASRQWHDSGRSPSPEGHEAAQKRHTLLQAMRALPLTCVPYCFRLTILGLPC